MWYRLQGFFLSWYGFSENGHSSTLRECDFMIDFDKNGSPNAHAGNGSHSRAFSLFEVIVVVLVLVLLVSGVFLFLNHARVTAHNISAQYDLRNFVAFQEQYFAYNKRYLGSAGDFIEADNPLSTLKFSISGFKSSPGVVIEIVSGDGADFKGVPPFQAGAWHRGSNRLFVYDFSTMKTNEREREHNETEQ